MMVMGRICCVVLFSLSMCFVLNDGVAASWYQFQNNSRKAGFILQERIGELSVMVCVAVGDDPGATVFSVASAGVVAGTAYVGGNDGGVVAVGIGTKTELWRIATGGPIRGVPAIQGERVYVVSQDGILRCLDPNDDGNEIWRFDAGAPLAASPAVARLAG